MTRIFVEDIELDINGELSQQLTFAIDDLNNLDSKSTSFSKTIVIPGTNTNNQVFGNIFEFSNANFDNLSQPNVFYNFNASRSAKARIEINGLEAMKGVLRLLSIVVDNGKVEYEIALFGELGGFVSSLSNKKLTDIDFSDFNHVWDIDNIIRSWDMHKPIHITDTTEFDGATKHIVITGLSYPFMKGDIIQIDSTADNNGIYTITNAFIYTFGGTDYTDLTIAESLVNETDSNFYVKILNRGLGSGRGYIYPLINYGNVTSTFGSYEKYKDFLVDAFRPALYVKTYFDRIINGCGYTYESNFMESDFFKRLIIPHNEADMYNADVTEYANISDDAATSGVTSVGYPSVDYNLPLVGTRYQFDYSATNKILTYTGTFTKQMKISGKIEGTANIQYGASASFDLKVNGVSVLSYPLSVNGSTIVSFFFDKVLTLSTNDTIELTFNAMDSYTGLPGGMNFMVWDFDVTQTLYIQNDPPSLISYVYGDSLKINNLIPKNIQQKDFVTSLMKMFNLMVVEDKYKEKHLIIEPYIDFFDLDRTSYEDWSLKVDRAKPIKIKPMSETNARIYNFKYKQDSDYYAEEYRKKFNEGYGDRIYDNELEFAKDSQNVEVIFSSSVITEFPVDDKIYPSILKVTNDVEERISHNIRIMQVAVIPNTLGLIYDNVTSPTNLYSMNRYCYSGHLDNPRVPTADINWGSPQEVKFNLTAGSLSNNLFNAFYSPYMAEITDKDSRLVTCEMYLNEIDIFRLDFSKFKMIDGVLYRLSKVIDWSSPSTCKVDLLRVINTTYTNEAHYFRTANLCDRVWSCENLNVKNFKNGDAIRFITNQSDWDYYSGNLYEPCCAYPDFDEANASYGLLYNWFAVNDSRGLAEEGWRVSTDEDWEKLQDCIANTNNLKEVGGFHWDYLNGTDAYGFTALGSGNIQGDGSFQDFRQYAHFWTSISVSADEAKYQRIFGNSGTYDLRDGNKKQGKSIRLVKI